MRAIQRLGLTALALLAACADRGPLEPDPATAPLPNTQRFECIARVHERTVTCAAPAPVSPSLRRGAIIGGQGQFVKLTTTNVAFDAGTGIFSGDVTVQNLLPYAMGTQDGVSPDPAGIRVFFHTGPTVTSGWGVATVQNPDGVGTFTATNQPWFQYPGILGPGQTSAAKSWRFHLDPDVAHFAFTLFVSAHTAPTLVISEIMARPSTASEPAGEWFEVHNRTVDPIDLQGWTIASGGDAPHTIATPVVVPAKGYVVLGGSTDGTANGGVRARYAYTGIDLGNGTTDWLALRAPAGSTADSVDWGAAPGESALPPPTGASLELDSLDNDNLHLGGASSHWTVAAAAFGSGQKGTPGSRRLVQLRAVSITAGYSRTCAVDPDGQAWCWGGSHLVEVMLGNGDSADSAHVHPVRVIQPPGVRFTQITAGLINTCALATTGVVYCWGSYVPTGTSLAMRSTAVAVPATTTFASVGALGGFGGMLGCALDASGQPWCWGTDRFTLTPEPAPGPLAQLSLDYSVCVRTVAGQAWCRSSRGAGGDTLSLVSQPGVTFQWVHSHDRQACGISTIGQMLCWNPGVRVPSIVPHPSTVRFTSVAVAGTENACAVATTGIVWCRGANVAGQLGDGTFTDRSTLAPVQQPPGVLFSTVVLTRVIGPVAEDYSYSHACALQSGNGNVYCWGLNDRGQLGDGTRTNRPVPVPVFR
ncbi:MAG TPA: lamin tail domain-containing protein [Longimicrobium sp.]